VGSSPAYNHAKKWTWLEPCRHAATRGEARQQSSATSLFLLSLFLLFICLLPCSLCSRKCIIEFVGCLRSCRCLQTSGGAYLCSLFFSQLVRFGMLGHMWLQRALGGGSRVTEMQGGCGRRGRRQWRLDFFICSCMVCK
jgi:hypothetical protein